MQFHPLTISELTHDTRDALVVTFHVPTERQSAFAFKAGQYLTLKATIDGVEERRSYSICSAEGGALRVGIKRVEDGVFSTWAHSNLKVGDTVQVMLPQGKFGEAALDKNQASNQLLIAAGSGITPMLSILKTGLQANAGNTYTLIYGNRATSAVMFREELMQLKDRYKARLNLVFVMSREPQDFDLLHGRIERTRCEALFDQWLNVSHFDAAFICGPEQMMQDAKAALLARGMDAGRIKVELFGTGEKADSARPPRKTQLQTSGDATTTQVTLVMDGQTRHFPMHKGSETLLAAGLRAGVDMRYSCKGGVCSTCRAKVTHGQVEMDVNYALEDYELKRGFVLTCQSFATTDKVTVNFDEEN